MDLLRLLLWPVVALIVLLLLTWVQFYLSIVIHAHELRKTGWIVITTFRLNHAQLDAIHPDYPEAHQHTRLHFRVSKDTFDER